MSEVSIPRDAYDSLRKKAGLFDDYVYSQKDYAGNVRSSAGTSSERKRRVEVIKRTAGLWKGMRESGVAYERRLRRKWRSS